MNGLCRNIWDYRNFIRHSIKRELVANFARSKLGGLWTLLNPLAQVLIYALILSNILSAKLPGIHNRYAYALYLMAGTLGWTVFNELITRGLNLFTGNAGIMQKMNFPKITLPCIAVGSAVLNNVFLAIAMLVIFLICGHWFNFEVLWLVPITVVVVMFGIAIGMIVGVLNVFVRDIAQFIPILLQVWFWFTPIVYPETIIPAHYRHLLYLNPMYPIVDAYHQVLVYGKPPHLHFLLYIAILSIVLLSLAMFLFKRASAEMVDVL